MFWSNIDFNIIQLLVPAYDSNKHDIAEPVKRFLFPIGPRLVLHGSLDSVEYEHG